MEAAEAEYLLHLFVAGDAPGSAEAVRNLRNICERYLAGRVALQIVDIQQQPDMAQQEDIVATPTLVKTQPGLKRFLVGDLSDRRRVLAALGLVPDPNDPT